MQILPRLRTKEALAQSNTDYRVTDGYCMELYYIVREPAVLMVKTRGQDYIESNIASATIETKVKPV